MVSTYFSRYIILLLFIYLFNGFHHDHNAKIRQGRRNAFEEVTRMRQRTKVWDPEQSNTPN